METELCDYQPVVWWADHPVEFPVVDVGLEDCACHRHGQHVVLKPASYTRLSALLFAEIVAEAGCLRV